MKRALTIITAIALVLGLSQCKKKEVKPEATDQGIFITLDASYNGAKTGFDPTGGTFVWSDATEYIYVGESGRGYLGQLTGTGDGESSLIKFSGTIGTPSDGATLYFFYLGNGDHAGTNTLDFSNQAGDLAHVTDYHIAMGSEVYSGQTSFTATLDMKVAFARIDMSGFAGETVYVHGDNIYATATIDYATGEVSGGIEGFINVGIGSADKYVALIPSTDSQITMKFDSNGKTGNMVFLNGIQAGKFYANTGGSALQFLNAPQSLMGSSSGLFSLAETRGVITSMVRFSPGNLQYQPSTATWRFAEHQYDMAVNEYQINRLYIYMIDYENMIFELLADEQQYNEYLAQYGEGAVMIVDAYENAYCADSEKWIDLFGYGTWGAGKIPYNTSTDEDEYQWSGDFSGTISNNSYTGWRTLTSSGDRELLPGIPTNLPSVDYANYFNKYEWGYLLYNRSCGNRFAKAYLDTDDDGSGDTHGLIMIPDNYMHPNVLAPLTGINDQGATSWNGNSYNTTEWAQMEAAGAVFLTCSGDRLTMGPMVEQIGTIIAEVNISGYYWGIPEPNYDGGVKNHAFGDAWLYDEGGMNTTGCSVRLVRDVQ